MMPSAVSRSRVIIIVALCLIISLGLINYFHKSMLSMASYLVYPVISIQHYVIDPIKQRTLKRKTIEELEKELAVLREEYDEMLADTIAARAQKVYWGDIKEVVEFSKQYDDMDGIVAQVLARNFSEQTQIFLIDAGEQKGITNDMVVVYKNNLIGKVIEVFPWYSKVSLITDRLCKVAATCSSTNTHGIHEGANNLQETALQYVSHLDELIPDDIILSSGEGTIFPQGFALGKVMTIAENGFYKKVTVKPLIDLASLDYCVVIKKK